MIKNTNTPTHKWRILQGREMSQLIIEKIAKRGELQDAQAEEGLKQHKAGGDYDDGEMVLQ